jgi:hypothetical protein
MDCENVKLFILFIFVFTIITSKKIKDSSTIDESQISYTTNSDLTNKINDLKAEKMKLAQDEIQPDELIALKNEELQLKKNVLKAALDFGDESREKASALHALGRNMYKQGKYDTVYNIAKEITLLHEKFDGSEHINTASALGNVGSVAYRIGDKNECYYSMNRALYILIKIYGHDSKEVIIKYVYVYLQISSYLL